MAKRIESILRKALLQDGEMEDGLYEYELAEHIDDWREGMERDKEDFLFVVTENGGDVAMLLITIDGRLFINEKARNQLKLFWKKAYAENVERFLPLMAKQLSAGELAVTGVKLK